MIIPRYYENPGILHENTMPHRAYYIPAGSRMDTTAAKRTDSDRFELLSGSWLMRYYESIYDLNDPFYADGFPEQDFVHVQVPHVWQNDGFDAHQYTNYRYPFAADPPYVPQENPCAAYIRHFDYTPCEKAPDVYLIFEGVDSCFYVWLNGQYVGYSQVSHSTSEFCVTPFLYEGDNKLSVLVLKWCDGSYLEDQDKFRTSGIFRDVCLLKRPRAHIRDCFIHTKIKADTADVTIDLQMTTKEGAPAPLVTASLYDEAGKRIASKTGADQITLTVEEPVLWNCENPYLYTLYLETPDEVITEQVGVREVRIENSVVLLNGAAIRFRGINRHESDPVTGPVTSPAQIMADLRMMKEHNFNAIRTSHYPNVPYFYQLCDRLGFLVIDEADNESHGPWMLCYRNDTDAERAGRWNELISDNPDYIEATLDRTAAMVEMNKNRPCILVWSMGNECGYGVTFERALAWTRQRDPDRLTHYEIAYYRGRARTYDYSNLDLYSRMYPDYQDLPDYAQDTRERPFLMCEYAHSMGNGPGDLEEYFQLMASDPIFCGGFVWEWCDHAIDHGKASGGRTVYAYGGDHGEILHDANFCMDGLVYPDRRPHTGLLEYKNVHRPVRAVSFDPAEGVLCLRNELDFTDLKGVLYLSYEVSSDGEVLQEGHADFGCADSFRPHETVTVTLPVSVPASGRSYLYIAYCLKDPVCSAASPAGEKTALLPAHFVMGFDEITLREDPVPVPTDPISDTEQDFCVTETDRHLLIRCGDDRYQYNKLTGLFSQITVDGKALLTEEMALSVWRAPTDNDAPLREVWEKARYEYASARAYETTFEYDAKEVVIRTHLCVSAPSVQKILDIHASWQIKGHGILSCRMDVVKDPEFPELPRFGLRLMLPSAMDEVCWNGLGPMENYADKRRAARHGIFRASVRDLHEDYIRPQENGSRGDVSSLTVCGGGLSLTASASEPFSFQASPYTTAELTHKKHHYELEESGSTVLHLDYKQNGIGSASCGPRLMEKYRFDDPSFSFKLNLHIGKEY